MCLTVPARVIAVDGHWAEVDVDGAVRRASILPVPDVRPGDWGIVAAGTIVRLIDPGLAVEIAEATRLARDPSNPSIPSEEP
jgi:hydrogenase assembly chaperone HypC/HupF